MNNARVGRKTQKTNQQTNRLIWRLVALCSLQFFTNDQRKARVRFLTEIKAVMCTHNHKFDQTFCFIFRNSLSCEQSAPKDVLQYNYLLQMHRKTLTDHNENTYLNGYTEHHKSIENSSDNITEFHNVNFLLKK